MKKIILACCLVFLAVCPAQAKEEVTEAKLELARKILDIAPASEQLDLAIKGLEQRVPNNKRAQFRRIIRDSVDVDRLSAAALLSMTEIFTQKELEVMYEYQASTEGKAIQKKLPDYQAQLKPVIESMLRGAMVEMQKNNVPFQ